VGENKGGSLACYGFYFVDDAGELVVLVEAIAGTINGLV